MFIRSSRHEEGLESIRGAAGGGDGNAVNVAIFFSFLFLRGEAISRGMLGGGRHLHRHTCLLTYYFLDRYICFESLG